MKRIYVAGAYSAPTVVQMLENMQRGIRLAAQVQAAGHAPYCPWSDCLIHFQGMDTLDLERCYAVALAWLEVSHAVLVQPVGAGQSLGTSRELARADELGIPVFYSLEGLLSWANSTPA